MKKGLIYIYDYIGDGGITANDVQLLLTEMEDNGAESFEVHINSPGGYIFDGFAIYNLLKQRDVDVYIDSLAASIASLIAMAGKNVYAYKNSFMIIHNPWTVSWGDAREMEKRKNELDALKEAIVRAYAEKTGMDEEEIKNLMDEEVYLDAEEALKKGFIDKILDRTPEKNFVAFYNLIEDKNKPGDKKMNEQLLKFFGLNLESTDEQITEKINSLKEEFGLSDEATIQDLVAKMTENNGGGSAEDFSDTIKSLQEKITVLENKLKDKDEEEQKAKAESLIENAVNDGKIMPADKEVWVKSAMADYEGTEEKLKARKKFSAVPGKVNLEDNTIDLENPKEIANAARAYMKKEKENGNIISYAEAVNAVMKQ